MGQYFKYIKNNHPDGKFHVIIYCPCIPPNSLQSLINARNVMQLHLGPTPGPSLIRHIPSNNNSPGHNSRTDYLPSGPRISIWTLPPPHPTVRSGTLQPPG